MINKAIWMGLTLSLIGFVSAAHVRAGGWDKKKVLTCGRVEVPAIAGFTSVSALAGSQVQSLTGAVMCRAEHGSTDYSLGCPAHGAHYVFVSRAHVFDIKHQTFSGLGPLVGQPLRVVGEVHGNVVDILTAREVLPTDCPDDDEL